eukprot:2473795-Rhodomonas_salina.1
MPDRYTYQPPTNVPRYVGTVLLTVSLTLQGVLTHAVRFATSSTDRGGWGVPGTSPTPSRGSVRSEWCPSSTRTTR